MKRTIVKICLFFFIPICTAQITASYVYNSNQAITEVHHDTTSTFYRLDKVGNRVLDSVSSAPAVFLPITWLEFTANGHTDSQRYSKLNWQITEETKVDLFEVQWITDANTWHPVDSVTAQNGQTHYSSTHRFPEPFMGRNYYRLKQWDKNGQSSFSDIRVVVFKDTRQVQLNLIPNPADGLVTIKISGKNLGVYENIKVFTFTGIEVAPEITKLGKNHWQLNTSTLPAGSYLVEVKDRFDTEILIEQLIVE